jgi:hypothetical protein
MLLVYVLLELLRETDIKRINLSDTVNSPTRTRTNVIISRIISLIIQPKRLVPIPLPPPPNGKIPRAALPAASHTALVEVLSPPPYPNPKSEPTGPSFVGEILFGVGGKTEAVYGEVHDTRVEVGTEHAHVVQRVLSRGE